jgi:hypothetical protein
LSNSIASTPSDLALSSRAESSSMMNCCAVSVCPVFGLMPETLVLMFSQNSSRKPPTGLPNLSGRQLNQVVLREVLRAGSG